MDPFSWEGRETEYASEGDLRLDFQIPRNSLRPRLLGSKIGGRRVSSQQRSKDLQATSASDVRGLAWGKAYPRIPKVHGKEDYDTHSLSS